MNNVEAGWDGGVRSKADRLAQAEDLARGKWVEAADATLLLERLLRPGMFASAELVTGARSLPAVPRAALRTEAGSSRAFAMNGLKSG